MMRGRDKARLKHLALGAKEPFTMSLIIAKWKELYGMRQLPTTAQISSGIRELRAEGFIELVGKDANMRSLWIPRRE